MFLSRLDYALTNLGWLGFLTALYFLCIGVWLAHMLWCRSKAGVWQDRSEIFEEYKTLYQRAVENQEELLEACDIHETQHLRQEALIADLRLKLDESEERCVSLRENAEVDHETILQREKQLQALYDKVAQAQNDTERQKVENAKAAAEYDAKTDSLSTRISDFEITLNRVNNEKRALSKQLGESQNELKGLRGKYAELMQQFADAKEQQATYSKLTVEQKAQVDQLSQQITGLESNLSLTSQEAQEARDLQASSNEELQHLRGKYTDLMQQYATAKEGEASFSKMTEEQQERLNALSDQIQQLEKTLSVSNEANANARQQQEATLSELEAIRGKYAKLMQQYASAKEGEESFYRIDKEHKSLQVHLSELKEEMVSVQGALSAKEGNVRDLSKELSKVRAELQDRTKAVDELRSKHASTTAELDRAYQTLIEKEKVESNLGRVEGQLETARKQLVATRSQLDQSRSDRKATELELADVSDQLLALQGEFETVKEDDERAIATLQEQLEQAEAKLSEIIERPSDADDLTEIVGISRRMEEELNEVEIFRFDQIADWTPEDEVRHELLLKIPGRVRDCAWVEQAKDLLGIALAELSLEDQPEPSKPKVTSYVRALRQYGNLSVKIDEKLGVIFTKRPTQVDDLTVISGIGKVNEKCLRENGVYRLRQIADWNEYNVWAFNQLLEFKGRIEREHWVAQARRLSKQPNSAEPNQTEIKNDQRQAA